MASAPGERRFCLRLGDQNAQRFEWGQTSEPLDAIWDFCGSSHRELRGFKDLFSTRLFKKLGCSRLRLRTCLGKKKLKRFRNFRGPGGLLLM